MNFGHGEALEQKLKEIMEQACDEAGQIGKYKTCVGALQEGIRESRKAMEVDGFETHSEEIRYFKQEAPKMHGKLFFFMKLVQIECWRQYNSKERFLELLRGTVRDAEHYLEKHATMCEYYYQEKTHWDEHLFTRQGSGEWSAEEVGTFIGEGFTLGSYWVSWIIANEHLREWVGSELGRLESAAGEGIKKKVKKLVWSGKKVDLVELAYALYLKASFNHGKAALKDVMEWFEVHWEVSLGNYHVTIDEMAIRKKSRTKFLHELMEELEMKMDGKL